LNSVTIAVIKHLKLYEGNINDQIFMNNIFLLEYKYTNWTRFF